MKNIKSRTNTKQPQMFKDEPADLAIKQAKRISDFKNLGAVSEASFTKAGINSAKEFIKLGWKKTLIKLVESDPKNRHSIYAYALIGALKNIEWNRISDADKAEAKKFVASLKGKKK